MNSLKNNYLYKINFIFIQTCLAILLAFPAIGGAVGAVVGTDSFLEVASDFLFDVFGIDTTSMSATATGGAALAVIILGDTIYTLADCYDACPGTCNYTTNSTGGPGYAYTCTRIGMAVHGQSQTGLLGGNSPSYKCACIS